MIPPRRGWIVDRAGKPLALNKPDYRLELIPEAIEDLDAVLARVREVLPLSWDDELRIRADIAIQPKYMPVEVARDLDWPAFAALNVKVADVPGLQPVRAFAGSIPMPTSSRTCSAMSARRRPNNIRNRRTRY